MSSVNTAHSMFFFASRRRHTRYWCDWSSDVCSSDLSSTSRFRARDRLVEDRKMRCALPRQYSAALLPGPPLDRKSVVEGKRVDFGGRRIIKKKKAPSMMREDVLMLTAGAE